MNAYTKRRLKYGMGFTFLFGLLMGGIPVGTFLVFGLIWVGFIAWWISLPPTIELMTRQNDWWDL